MKIFKRKSIGKFSLVAILFFGVSVANAQHCLLDSIYHYDGTTPTSNVWRKVFYAYNANGKPVEELTRDSSGTTNNAWVSKNKRTWTYDANGNQTLKVYSEWHVSQWISMDSTIATYDANNNQTSLVYRWFNNGPQVWITNDWAYTTYNAQNKPTLKIRRLTGYPIDTLTYTYNAAGLNDTIYTKSANGTITRNIYTYNGDNKRVTDLWQTFNSGTYENSELQTTSYSTDYLKDTLFYQYWQAGAWVDNAWKVITIYKADGEIESQINYQYHNNVWEKNQGFEYTWTYNGDNRVSKFNHREYQGYNGTETPYSDDERTYTYDLVNATDSVITIEWRRKDYGNPNWMDMGFYTEFFSCDNAIEEPDTTSVHTLNSIISGIYPNPANTVLNIEVKENTAIRIVNMLGVIVSEQALNTGANTINVSELTNGVYFVQAGNSVVKFIKE